MFLQDLSERRINNHTQGGLMLTRHPIASTGNQTEIGTTGISKNTLQRRVLRSIQGRLPDMKMQYLSGMHEHRHFISDVNSMEIPENSRHATRTVQMAIDDRTPPLARAHTTIVPANVVPGFLPGRIELSIRQNPYRLYQ